MTREDESNPANQNASNDRDVLLATAWPLTYAGARILLALANQPASIRALSRELQLHRKTVRQELEKLVRLGWVVEVDNVSGPHRMHALTPAGEVAHELLLRILETCEDFYAS